MSWERDTRRRRRTRSLTRGGEGDKVRIIKRRLSEGQEEEEETVEEHMMLKNENLYVGALT